MLGTLPGEESLRRGQYYAHPRNLFWPIFFALFGGPAPAVPATQDYADKLRLVLSRRVALWDVCECGERHASADATIRRESPNAIDELIASHPGIRGIAFNGSGARRLYHRHFAPRPELVYLALPSTSPAYASLGYADKLARWSALRDVLGTE